MIESASVVAVGVLLIAAAVFDLARTFRRSGRQRLAAALLHSFVWAAFVIAGVASIDYATTSDASMYAEHLLRASRAFAGSASAPFAPPERLLLGLTRLAGRVYLIAVAFLIAAVLLQRYRNERRTG